ncbi:Protein max [Choanephora cucurbitarum]|uniref:Protein max n=1 Tax=Choanephora cucurbitarum TaxID=101091 RepID=A0A1C7NI07_9FUNG|nr:Protein max [Choanephora cucurbitarum]OBZ88744.1 Protein max [Choanephora cucurbitarum]
MYPSFDQSYLEQKPLINNPELLLLFDGYPTNANATFEETMLRRTSISTSATASPPTTEKELVEQIDMDDTELPNFNSRSRRASLNKAERRAEHNAIERARRECLNSKFQQLADALPNLQNHRRPSKGQIVEKALDWVKQNMSKEDRYQYQIMQLQNENKRLLNQISMGQNEKAKSGIITPPVSSSPVVAPFPPDLRQQQFPASSTPTTSLNTKNCSTRSSSISGSSSSSSNSSACMPSYTADNLSLMFPMGMDWSQQQQNDFSMSSHTDFMMTSVSSSSRATQQEDEDEDNHSSNEDSQGYSDNPLGFTSIHPYALFDMNCALPVSNPTWDKSHVQSEYPYSMTF